MSNRTITAFTVTALRGKCVFYKGEVILLVEKRTRLFVAPQAGVATHVCRIGPSDAGHLSFLCLQVRTYIYVGTYVNVPRLP
jgi:hypothetical protein